MTLSHRYEVAVIWTGNTGEGTASYRAYGRDHDVRAAGSARQDQPGRISLDGRAGECQTRWVVGTIRLAVASGSPVPRFLA